MSHDVTRTALVAEFFFFTNSGCSSRVHWFVLGAVVEPAMHEFLWDAKGSGVYMCPLI